MSTLAPKANGPDRLRSCALAVIVVALIWRSREVIAGLRLQGAGADFSCFWAGARAALSTPERLYDFRYITALQGWPMGADIRPFIYPPSALAFYIPFALPPYWLGFGLWVLATGALFAWGGRRVGAPWWFLGLPAVLLVAICGQVTFLIGGLVMGGLALKDRPWLSGVLLGAAAAIKPQLLLFAPMALMAEARWRTMGAAGLTSAALCAVSLLFWGLEAWRGWLTALPAFQADLVIADPRLLEKCITIGALLARHDLSPKWALLLMPFAIGLVWWAFRAARDPADRLIAIFGAPLLVLPYAVNYEAALFAPAVAAYLVKIQDRLWPAYALAAVLYVGGLVLGPAPLLAALSLPLLGVVERRLRPAA